MKEFQDKDPVTLFPILATFKVWISLSAAIFFGMVLSGGLLGVEEEYSLSGNL